MEKKGSADSSCLSTDVVGGWSDQSRYPKLPGASPKTLHPWASAKRFGLRPILAAFPDPQVQ